MPKSTPVEHLRLPSVPVAWGPTASGSVPRAALKAHICFSPGSLFSPTHRYRSYLRPGLGGPWNPAQREAINCIGALGRRTL